MRPCTPPLVALLAIGLVGGCGSSGGTTTSPADTGAPVNEREEVARIANDMFDAWADGDGERTCELLTTEGQLGVIATVAEQSHARVDAGLSSAQMADKCREVVDTSPSYDHDDYRFTADGVSFSDLGDPAQPGQLAFAACEFRGSVYLDRVGDGWKVSLPACND